MAFTDNVDDTVEPTLQTLVNHYSQPIHQETRTKQQQAAPYFDALLGRPVEVSPVTQQLLNRLINDQQQRQQQVILKWICGYQSHVRPELIAPDNQVSVTGLPVLEQYEIVLSLLLLQDLQTQSLPTDNKVASTVMMLAKDISLLTETTTLEKTELLANHVLPTMLRITSQCIPFLNDNVTVKRACALSLLSFGHSRMDPRLFLDVQEIISCILSVEDVVSVDINTHWLDWNLVQLNGTLWDDPVTGIATRAAQSCWNALFTSESINNHDGNDDCVKKRVLQQLGWLEMAKLVRAHFFGRDDEWSGDTTLSKPTSKWQYPLPQMPQPLPNASIAKRPSRVHVALQFVYLVMDTTTPLPPKMLPEILPVMYALLDSTPKHVAMGAAGLLCLYQLVSRETWSEFQEPLIQVLSRAVFTTREGPAVFLVALAQSRAFSILETNVGKERRQATQQMLHIVQKNPREGNIPLILGLLVGGIVPLLKQLAEEPRADAMEFGRLGLSTLLSLLQSFDSATQGAALVALIHLLLGAYPIMPRHGGLIMSHLVSCLGDACEKDGSIVKIAATAAAMALTVCGESAAVILERIESADDFIPMLIQQVSNIRQEAIRLQEMNNGKNDRID